MPSCEHDEAIVLAPVRKRSWTMRAVKAFLLLFFLVVLGIGGLWAALENGNLDETLTAQAEGAMARALGADFAPDVKAVRLRFSSDWMLALEAADVEVKHIPSGVVALRTNSIKVVLDPMALMGGKIVLARAEIDTADGDLSFMPQGPAVSVAAPRVDAVPALLDRLYAQLDGATARLDAAGTHEVLARNLSLHLPGPTGRTVKLIGLDFERQRAGAYRLTTKLAIDRITPDIAIDLVSQAGKVQSLDATVSNIPTEPFAMKYSKATGERRQGFDLPLTLALSSVRETSLHFAVSAGEGTFQADGTAQPVRAARAMFDYDFAAGTFALHDGSVDLGATQLPLKGSLRDLDKVTPGATEGYAFDIMIENGVSNAALAGEAPQPFNARFAGQFIPSLHELSFPELTVSTESGTLDGKLKFVFADHRSPAVDFSAEAQTLSTRSVKQLWPFWFAQKQREWVISHISGGSISNATLSVSLAAGRLPEHPIPFRFEKDEFNMAFDAEGLTIHYLGELPPVSAASGSYRQKDRHIEVAVDRGSFVLPSGKVLDAADGTFVIEDTSQKPTMASLSLTAKGDASSAIEYVGFKPIDAGSKLPFAPGDVKGAVSGDISAYFGVNPSQKPPKPTWKAALSLKNVDVAKPIEGRKIEDLNGKLEIDNTFASLDGKAKVDGLALDLKLRQPITGDMAAREWEASGDLSEAEVKTFAPALEPYVKGGVNVSLKTTKDGQRATVSLRDAALSIPIVNWRKGAGVRATAEFLVIARNGETRISDFSLEGDGFGARGEMLLDKRGLVSGKFTRVKLSPADNFSVSLERKSGGISVDVTGDSIDAKPFIETAKTPADPQASEASSNVITAQIDRAVGYNKETIRGLDIRLVTASGRISTLSLSGVTSTEQALVIRKDSDQGAMEITSGDAGAVARFADLYRNMNGGLLNITLKARDADSWRGSIDIRNFALINEARLKAIVSARGGSDGRSLTDALKTDIDTSSQKFRRAFARLIIDGATIKVENGIVRGDQVGASFQGTVRSKRGNMDLTGTFMPAYGINSLFGQLPLIGAILGNGRDRGLLGITFKLEGPYDSPKMSVNPLSLIAPGVFRNIFEFE